MSLGPERRRVTANSGFWCGPTALQSYAGVLKTSAKDDPNISPSVFAWRTVFDWLSRSRVPPGKTTGRLMLILWTKVELLEQRIDVGLRGASTQFRQGRAETGPSRQDHGTLDEVL